MNVITRRTVIYYSTLYPMARIGLNVWHDDMLKAAFNNFNEVKEVYGNASVVANNRVVFNIKGNTFRLVASFDFRRKAVYVIWFGTHSEYDKIDVTAVKHIKNPNKNNSNGK